MELLDKAVSQLLYPPILFFVLGMFAALVRSDLKISSELGAAMRLFLLCAIGLKGGVGIAKAGIGEVLVPALAAIVLGIGIVLIGYLILTKLKFDVANAGTIAGHYGAVSATTMIFGFAYLEEIGVYYEAFAPALYPFMDGAAIVTAILLTRVALAKKKRTGIKVNTQEIFKEGIKVNIQEIFKEVVLGKAVLLLMACLVIGYAGGVEGTAGIMPFFDGMFKGVLCLFMLDMGLIAASRLRDWRIVGHYLVAYALIMPPVHGIAGVALGSFIGLSVGGATMLGILAASGSYISAPAAMRAAIPEANPSLSLTAAVALTFPFNIFVGIPLYYMVAQRIAIN